MFKFMIVSVSLNSKVESLLNKDNFPSFLLTTATKRKVFKIRKSSVSFFWKLTGSDVFLTTNDLLSFALDLKHLTVPTE